MATLVAGSLALAAPSAVRAQFDPNKVVYIACYVFTAGGDGTAIAVKPYRTTFGDWFNGRWENRLYEQILPGTGYYAGRCNPWDSAEQAEEWFAKSGYHFIKRVDWPKDPQRADKPSAPVAKAAPKPAPKPAPTGYLEVKTDTSAKDAAKAWDEQVKKTLAVEAQKKVETAAKAAQQDAETKRKIAEFMAERRRQGNKQ